MAPSHWPIRGIGVYNQSQLRKGLFLSQKPGSGEFFVVSSVRSSYSHPDLLLITTPLFQITPVLNTGLSLSEPLQLYKGYDAI